MSRIMSDGSLMYRKLAFVAFAGISLACTQAQNDASSYRGRQTDSVIYDVLLDSLRPGRRPAYVDRQFWPFSPQDTASGLAQLAGWLTKQHGEIDSALVIQLVQARYAGTVDTIVGHPPGVRWVDSLRSTRDPAEGRQPWRRLGLSRIAYSRDSTHALVYAFIWCGGLCGDESFYLLQREPSGHWHVVARVIAIIA